MDLTKTILKSYKKIIEENRETEFVQNRYKHNILREGNEISKKTFWKGIVLGILTTQTTNTRDFSNNIAELKLTDYTFMSGLKDKEEYVRKLKGIRFTNKKPESIARSIDILNDNWTEIKKYLETIFKETNLKKERIVADYIREIFKGNQIKFKQSRNIIQMMGLSQYVVPLDSRVMGILLKNGGITMPELVQPLASNHGYCDIENQVNELCAELGVKPCIFDACAYVSKGKK